ncbi:MAG TPA: anti-sigma factor [Xanthobacteraceae bacterium]|nr:anti-sigma factor [Xanthobacteraceae bacterium]
MYDDDRDALAAEYVLGTLSADEREQAEALLAIDPGFAEIVHVWERRLGELNVMVEAVEPPAEVWDKIKSEIVGPEVAAHGAVAPEPRFTAEEEFSFPAIEETSPPAASAVAAEELPAIAAADETAVAERYEHDQEQPVAPDAHAPLVGDEAFQDLLAGPLPEAPEDADEPSELLASSLLPPEPESVSESAVDKKPEPDGAQDLEAELEADLKAVVLSDLIREDSDRDELGEDSRRDPAAKPFTPVVPPRAERDVAERNAEVIVLARRARRWRRMTAAMTAIAALLALYVGVSQFAPGLIPVGRHAPSATTAQVASAPPAPRLVAVLQQDPTTPAFLVSIDPTSRQLTVRRVSATPEPGRSYELWLISSKYPAPQSLGLVGASEFTARALPSAFDADTIKTASYAISLEPAGGSPTGAPTGPILFKGQIVESLPDSAE